MEKHSDIAPAGRLLLYLASLVIVISGLKLASSIIVPFILAIFFTTIFSPLLSFLQSKIPAALALLFTLLLLITIFLVVSVVIGSSLQQLITSIPEIKKELQTHEPALEEFLEKWKIGISKEQLITSLKAGFDISQLGTFLSGAFNTAKDSVLILIMTGFMLTEVSWFSKKLKQIDNGAGEGSERVNQIAINIRRYMVIKTVVSIFTGIAIWLGLTLLGVEYAILWGFIAVLLNYIPTIGSAIAGIPPIFIALVQDGFGTALLIGGLYLLVNQLFGNVIEPRAQGKGLGLSPMIVFSSLIFWGWVLGPVGVLLSPPLTMAVRITLEEFEETKWIAVMIGGDPKTA
jgi:AI-2 transport protein TqsA